MLIPVVRVFLGLAVLGWLVSVIRIERRKRDRKWTLGPDEGTPEQGTKVSVLVPARNEYRNIEKCVRSILAQEGVELEIIVLNDGSTDGTSDVLQRLLVEDDRLEVIDGGEELPEGWYGKAWALHRAQQKATSEWLVFVDADVCLHPQAVSSVVAYGQKEEVDMVSGIGRLEMLSFWEKVMQPAVAGLILAGNNMDHVNDPKRDDRVLANGQFIAIRRSAYDEAGGHQSVRQNVLDDVGLAESAVGSGARYRFLVLRELFSCRMYTSFSEIWSGWSKNLFAGMKHSWIALLLVIFFLFNQVLAGPLLLTLGLMELIALEWVYWGATLCGLMQIVRFQMDRVWGLNPIFGLTHAPANVLLIALLLNSGLSNRRGVAWKGRKVS